MDAGATSTLQRFEPGSDPAAMLEALGRDAAIVVERLVDDD